jgi:transcriptional regulator with XRE-family HTH domain
VKVEDIKGVAKAQTLRVGTIGDFIREQRELAQVSVRQLSKLAGVSNPYLSQIERGLRKPSAEILQQIAKGLRISAEQLYVRAGILEDRQGDSEVIGTILADVALSERQKSVLVEIYESFRRENDATRRNDATEADSPHQPDVPQHPDKPDHPDTPTQPTAPAAS